MMIGVAAVIISGCAGGLSRREAAKLYYNLGNAYLEAGDNAKASNAYLKALEYDKKLKIASYNLAKAYMEAGSYGEALGILEKMLQEESKNTLLLSAKGYCLYRSGDLSGAVEVYRHILEIDPAHTESLYNSAAISFEKENYSDAIEKLFLLRSRMTGNEEMLYRMNSLFGEIYYRSEQYEEAIQYFDYLSKKDPKNINNLILLFDSRVKSRYYASAIETGNSIIDLQPGNSDILFEMSYLYLTAVEDTEKGIEYLEKAIENGFSDKEKAKRIIDAPGVGSVGEIRRILEKEKLLDN